MSSDSEVQVDAEYVPLTANCFSIYLWLAVSIFRRRRGEVFCSMQRMTTYIIQVLGLLGIEGLRHFGCFGGV
jgi:hypothetical protein